MDTFKTTPCEETLSPYATWFDLKEYPFRISPHAKFAYVTSSMREALEHGRDVINGRLGIACISGEIGTGKTTLASLFAREAGERNSVASLYRVPGGARQTEAQIHLEINRDLGIETRERAKSETSLRKLEAEAWRQHEQGDTVVILLDDAHLLRPTGIHALLSICNMTAVDRPLVQILLFGQNPEMIDVLKGNAAFHSRLTMHTQLSRLDAHDLEEMIAHRLKVAGAKKNLFDDGAIALLYEYSRGVPRIACTIANRAMSYAADLESTRIHIRHVTRAAHALGHGETP
jgi:general secretion pathway protein A